MATFIEHANLIKAAIKAAQDDGFKLDVDLSYDQRDGMVDLIEFDLWNKGNDYVTVHTEDRR